MEYSYLIRCILHLVLYVYVLHIVCSWSRKKRKEKCSGDTMGNSYCSDNECTYSVIQFFVSNIRHSKTVSTLQKNLKKKTKYFYSYLSYYYIWTCVISVLFLCLYAVTQCTIIVLYVSYAPVQNFSRCFKCNT